MKRSLVVLVMFALAGCGFDMPSSQSSSSSNTPVSNMPSTGGGAVPVAIVQNAATVKVVLKTSRAVESYVGPTDSEGGVTAVPCTPGNSTDLTTCRSYNAAATCSATSLKCVTTSYVPSKFYVLNQPVDTNPTTGAKTVSFPVPCDGKDYQVDLYSKAAAPDTTTGNTILEVQTTPAAFQMVLNTTNNTCSPPTAGIGLVAGTLPSLFVPTLYAGMPTGLNTFTVAPRGNSTPWASTWTVTATGATQNATDQTLFTAPSIAGNVVFTAKFQLDNSVLVGADVATDWQYAFQRTVAALPVGTVTN